MWPYPTILVHRGGGTLAPENTFAGLRAAAARNCRAVEFDAMLARDGVPVLMHDPYFGRTIAATGRVADFDAAELAAMDAGSWLDLRFAGEGVPTLAAALRLCRETGLWPNVEIKPAPGMESDTGRMVARTVKQCRIGAEAGAATATGPLLSSLSLPALHAAREEAPDLARAWLVERVPANWRDPLAACEAVALHADHRHLTAPQARDVKAAGFGLLCYTVNDPARAAELFSWGVDAVCTDRPDLVGAPGRRG
ncbi:MAG: glycerophosphodiester phosphodiesterase [Burkholderiaceae bacterium]